MTDRNLSLKICHRRYPSEELDHHSHHTVWLIFTVCFARSQVQTVKTGQVVVYAYLKIRHFFQPRNKSLSLSQYDLNNVERDIKHQLSTNQKVLIFFILLLFHHKTISCCYSLEMPQRVASNECSQCMFSWRNKKEKKKERKVLVFCGYPLLCACMCGLIWVLVGHVCQKVHFLTFEVHYFWSAPLFAVIIIIYLLCHCLLFRRWWKTYLQSVVHWIVIYHI